MRRAIAAVGVALAFVPAAALVLLPAGAPAAERGVRIVTGSRFDPKDKFIVAGDTVLWTYDDANGIQHTVTRTASPERFDSSPSNCPGVLNSDCLDSSNRTYSHRFDTPGNYSYFCRLHGDQGMVGTIHVAPREAASPTPSRTSSSPSASPTVSPSGSGSPLPSGSPSPGETLTPTPTPTATPTPGPGTQGSGTGAKAVLALVALGALGGAGFWIYRRLVA